MKVQPTPTKHPWSWRRLIPERSKPAIFAIWVLARYGRLGLYMVRSRRIFTWRQRRETMALARLGHSLGPNATIVELGSFLGSTAIALAGGRVVRGSGMVHCVDAFDITVDNDVYPILAPILESQALPHYDQFTKNIADAGVAEYVVVHRGLAQDIARSWQSKIDLLFFDVTSDAEKVISLFDLWAPHVRDGGCVAIQDSSPGEPLEVLIRERLTAPRFIVKRLIGSITLVAKVGDNQR